MEPTVLSELPDTALYHLLTLCDTWQVLRFQRVLGKQRAPVFREVEKFFQRKYGLYDLSLAQIHSIVSLEDKVQSVISAFNLGDYPVYVEYVHDKLDPKDLARPITGRIVGNSRFDDLFGEATKKGREESALAVLRKESIPECIFDAMFRRKEKHLRYLISKHDFSALIASYAYMFKSPYSEEPLLWALETANPVVSAELITAILSTTRADVFNGGATSSELVRALLARADDTEVRTAYRQYRGGDERVRTLFAERLHK